MLLFYVIDVHIGTNRRKFRALQLAKHDFTIKRILTRGKKHTRCLPLMRANRTFALFFMVLDLRLVKIGCRETIIFFFVSTPKYAICFMASRVLQRPFPFPKIK